MTPSTRKVAGVGTTPDLARENSGTPQVIHMHAQGDECGQDCGGWPLPMFGGTLL